MIEKLLTYLLLDEDDHSVQKIQTQHRINLADFWAIKEGEKILEIGCGQGDTTAVLAELVGENGEVTALDIAGPDYGAPYTLGEATEHLSQSAIGSRIKFHLNTDFLDENLSFPEKYFDKVILPHCSWYFQDQAQLEKVLLKINTIGKEFCYAEWNTQISDTAQIAHLSSVLIQNQYQTFSPNAEANIRTLVTPDDIRRITKHHNFVLKNEKTLNNSELQDGSWEVSYVNFHLKTQILNDAQLPEKTRQLLLSQINEMNHYAASQLDPLDIYAGVWKL